MNGDVPLDGQHSPHQRAQLRQTRRNPKRCRNGMSSAACRPDRTWRHLVVMMAAVSCLLSMSRLPATAQEPSVAIKQVADSVLRDCPDPPDFNWGEGVLLTGMMQAYHLTHDERYLDFVRSFADHWAQRGIGPLLAEKGYCGHWGPGYPLWLLYQQTGDERHAALSRQIVEFMLDRAERTKDGSLSHFYGKPQLWVDTLAMCCPVLSTGSVIDQKPGWQSESVRQLQLFSQHLRDGQTGLYYHMWDETSDRRTSSFWARGNGWVVISLVETLRHQTVGSPERAELCSLLKQQLQSIVSLQDTDSGLWHTVLDAPDTYLETSASAMFLYGMLESRQLGLDGVPPRDVLQKTWQGLLTQIDSQGRIIGVSGGTGPSDQQGYATKIHGTYTWGTGAWLMAACSWCRQ